MQRLHRALLPLLLALLLAPLAHARQAPLPLDAPRRQALDQAVARILEAGKTPSLSVAVVLDDRLAYSRAVGLADVQRKIAATPQTRYRIGSISKVFTATAVMQLVGQRRVALEAPVARYLPWAPHAKEITVAQLLLHRSGLPDYGDRAIAEGRVRDPITPRGIVAYAGSELDFAPGTAYEYSNTNYVLLGQIVEAVARQPLGEYLQARVFEPAGMRATTFGDPPAGTPLATGYDLSSGQATAVGPMNAGWFYGCGSIVSTADDVARFDIALSRGRLLPAALVAEMRTAARPTQEPNRIDYGYGVQIFHLGDLTLLGHHGGLPGYEADDSTVVGEQFALVVLSNSFQFPTSSFLSAALELFYPTVLGDARAHPRPPPADAFPAQTARATAFLKTLATGAVDDTMCSPELTRALSLTQRAALGAQFALLGPPKKVTWLGVTRIGRSLRQEYLVEYAGKTLHLKFTFDPEGRISGFFLG